VTAVVNPPDMDGAADDVPLVVCVALDNNRRQRLATILDGVGVVMFTHDLATAHSMLGRQIMLHRPAATPGDTAGPVILAGDLEIDVSRCRATWRGMALALTQRERHLLACLAGGPTRVWTYRQLYDAAWTGRYLDPGPVQAAVKRLRRKLQHAGVGKRIAAVRGVGYELVDTDA
jgi:DNA-binding response OmpR family regulator